MGGAAVDIKGKANVSVYNGVMSAGVSTGCNSAGTTGTVSQQLIFCGGNNITLSQSITGQSATITIIGGAGGAGTTFSAGVSNLSNDSGQTGIVTNQIVFAGGNNITLSQSSNAGGYATVTIMGAAAGTGGGIALQGSGVSIATSGTVQFVNSNNITFGLNAQTVTASYELISHDSVYHTGTIGAEAQVTFDPVAGHDHDGVDSKLITTPGNASSILVNVKEMNVSPILKGQACYVAGATGGVLTVGLSDCGDVGKVRTIGLANDNIAQNGLGVLTNKGLLTGIDTRPTNLAVNPNAENWAPGELLWVTTTGGGMSHTRPDSGRSVKAAYTIKGSAIDDDLLVICFENPVWSTAADNENVVLRVGDAAGVNKVSIRDNTNTEIAYIDSYGTIVGVNIDATNKTDIEKYAKFTRNVLSTGLLNGGELSVNLGTPTTFDVAAGSGFIIDNYTDPENPTLKFVTWDAMVAVIDLYRLTTDLTGIAIERVAAGDGPGTLQQQGDPLYTDEQRRDFIVLGWTSHTTHGDLEDAYSEPYYVPDTMAQVQDFIENFGPFNIDGNNYEPSTLLDIKRSDGKVFDNGANYATTKKSPNIVLSIPEDPIVDYYYSYRDAAGDWVNSDAPLTDIDPNNYDKGVGFGKTAVPLDKWTIQTIFFYAPWAVTDIQYGQAIYDSQAAAESAISSAIEINPWIAYDVFRCWLIVQEGSTDLTDPTQAKFIQAGKLGLVSMMSGGTAGEVNTASNIGAFGVGLYHGKVGVDLQFKNINAGSPKITVTDNLTDDTVDIDAAADTALWNANKIQDKTFPALGAGDDEKFPKFDHDTSAFVMTPLINCVSLSGNNTAGVLANISTGTVYLAGGNNVTLSQNANSITISGENTHAQQTAISGISATDTLYNSGTVLFTGSNMITVKSSGAGQTIILDATQSVQTQTHNVTIGGNSTSAGAGYIQISTGTMLIAGGNNITLSQNGASVTISGANTHDQQTGISGISASDTVYTSGTVQFTGANMITVKSGANQSVIIDATQSVQTQTHNVTIGGNSTSAGAGYIQISTGTMLLAGGNNITLSQNGASVTISGPNTSAQQTGISSIVGSDATYTSGSVQFTGSNMITVRSSANQRIVIDATQSAQTGISGISATDTLYTSGTVLFTGSNMITVKSSGAGQTIILDATQSAQTGISSIVGSDATYTSGSVQFTGSNMITVKSSANQRIVIDATQSVQTQTHNVTIGGNSTSAGAGYIQISTGTMLLAGGNNITLSQNGASVTISGANVGGVQTGISSISVSDVVYTSGQVVFIGSNMITAKSGANQSVIIDATQSVQTQTHNVTLGGNSTSAGAGYIQISTGTMLLAGGNNITLSQNGASVTISGANVGGAQTGISGISASDTVYTSGTVQFTGANMITVKSGANQSIIIDATHPLQTGISGISATNTLYTSGTLLFTGSNMITVRSSGAGQTIILDATQSAQTGISSIVGSDATYTSGSVQFTGSNMITVKSSANQRIVIDATQSVQTQTHNVTLGGNSTSAGAGYIQISTGTMLLAGGNNITLSQNGASVTISGPNTSAQQTGISGISATNTLYTSGTILFTGSNMITVKSSGAGQTIILDATQSVQTQNSVLVNGSSGGISISGGNNITAGNNASTVTFSVHAQQTGISGISATNTLYNSGTVLFTGSNMITVKSSGAGQTIILDATQTIQTQNSVLVNGSSGGISISGGNNITAGNNASTVTFSVHAPQTGISVIGVIGSTNIFTSGSVIFSGSANITLSTSLNGASQYILISAPAPGAGGGIVVVPDAYATTFSTGSVFFSGLANITINSSVNGASQFVQISAPAPGGGGAATVKIYEPYNYMAVSNNMVQGTVFVKPLHIPYNMTATELNVLMHISNSASAGGTMSWNVGLYTYAVSTANTISSTLVTRAYNSTLGNSSSASNISGTRYRAIALNNWAFTPGDYLLAIGLSVGTGLTSGTYLMYGHSRLSIVGSEYSGAGNLLRWGYNGVLSAATNAVRASFHISDIVRTGSMANGQWWFNLLGTA